MPITLKSEKIKIKGENGNYVNISALAQASTQEYLDAIENKGLETIDSIPNDYIELSNDVDELKDDLQQMNLTKFDLSDRMAKGVDNQGNVINGAIIQGLIENREINGIQLLANKASGEYSHAQGGGTTASGLLSHAQGRNTIASADRSHAQGSGTTASGIESHTEGTDTTAFGYRSHAEGGGTIANHKSQHVFGEYNVADDSSAASNNRGNYVEIVGKGTANDARSNARTLDWSGNEKLAGSLTLGMGTANETTITAAQLSALLALSTTEGVTF